MTRTLPLNTVYSLFIWAFREAVDSLSTLRGMHAVHGCFAAQSMFSKQHS